MKSSEIRTRCPGEFPRADARGVMYGWIGPGPSEPSESWAARWRDIPHALPAPVFRRLPPTTGRAGPAVCWSTREQACEALAEALCDATPKTPAASEPEVLAVLAVRETNLFAVGWSVVETRVYRSSSRVGLWLLSVTVDGSKLWHGEEWSREAAVARVVAILRELVAREPAVSGPLSNI